MGNFISKISFPGLGIPEFSIDRVAFEIKIGSLTLSVTWYGMIICLGIILAFSYVVYRAGQAGISFDSILDFTLFTVPLAIIGARLYYVIFNPGNFHSLHDIIAVWEGGLAIYGAIIVGAIVVFCVAKFKKISFMLMADMAAPAVMLGQLIGRWGNFMNGEAFGGETTLPWRMGVCNRLTGFETLYVHPTFLYESLWNLVGFILINIFYDKKKFRGEVLLWYVSWYGLGRAFIETLRTDSLYLGNTDIRVSSLLGAVCALVCIPLLIFLRVRHHKMAQAGTISRTAPADITVLLGITPPPAIAEGPETVEIDLAEAMEEKENLSRAAKEKLFETTNETENAENGDMEE